MTAMIYHFNKQAITTFLIGIIPFFLVSQISIDSTDFGTSNDTVRISQAAPTITGYQSTGVNYSWDFSMLIPVSQTLKNFNSMMGAPLLVNLTYGTFASQEYQATYFTKSIDIPLDMINNFLPVDVEELNLYSKIDSSKVNSLGYSLTVDGQGVPFKSDTIETRYNLPLSYSQQDSSVGYTHVDLNPFSDLEFIQHRKRNSEVDGWGEIITPFGTFSVLRIKHEIIETDSVYQTFAGAGSWIALPSRLIKEYEWWSKGEKEAILKVVANDINGSETVQSVEYKDIYRGLDAEMNNLDSEEIIIYPNPASEKIFYKSEIPVERIYIQTLDGKQKLFKDLFGKSKGEIDLSLFPAGIYFIIVETAKFSYLNRIIID